MPKPAVRAATLRRAVEIAGHRALATLLQVEPARLSTWIEGTEEPPDDVFLMAVDLVTAEAPQTRLNSSAQVDSTLSSSSKVPRTP